MLFNIINDINSGIERMLSKFAGETKLYGTVNTPKGQDAIKTDLDRLQQWNLMNENRTLFVDVGIFQCYMLQR